MQLLSQEFDFLNHTLELYIWGVMGCWVQVCHQATPSGPHGADDSQSIHVCVGKHQARLQNLCRWDHESSGRFEQVCGRSTWESRHGRCLQGRYRWQRDEEPPCQIDGNARLSRASCTRLRSGTLSLLGNLWKEVKGDGRWDRCLS